ncbi:MAG: MBL fold metallo-hydrolase [Gemmatimonadota bacterium]|nr:MBL fold metallo-hydrolase [Gemmatimonadota bacterium]
MTRRILAMTVVACVLARTVASQSAGGVTVTFLANEGVMLAGGGRKVLIDALFERYSTGFALAADSTRAALAAARAPFDSVDLLLFTHQHGDHFHPAPTAAHLRANSRATLVTSAQVIDSMKRGAPGVAVPPRQLVARTTPPGSRRRETINGVAVEMLGIAHPGQRNRGVEHLVYVVEIGGRRVLHAGDGEFTEEVYQAFRLDTVRIDVALLPNWVVTSAEGKRVIERWIKPRQVVAIHLPDGAGATTTAAVQAAWPGAHAFHRSLDRRTW